ncbi:MAG: hypothetical protein JXR68_13080 [Bacteroidales bacterium]|nr:hypothetical protein [Bacteroidales bacterium]
MKEFTQEKQFSTWIDDSIRENLNGFIRNRFDFGEDLNTSKEVFISLLNVATSQMQPAIQHVEKNKDYENKITLLEQELIALTDKETNLSAKLNEAEANFDDLQQKFIDLQEQKEIEFKEQTEHLQSRTINKNDVIIKNTDLTQGQRFLLLAYLEDEKTYKNSKRDADENVLTEITQEMSLNEKIKFLLINTFVNSTFNRTLFRKISKPAIIKNLKQYGKHTGN